MSYPTITFRKSKSDNNPITYTFGKINNIEYYLHKNDKDTITGYFSPSDFNKVKDDPYLKKDSIIYIKNDSPIKNHYSYEVLTEHNTRLRNRNRNINVNKIKELIIQRPISPKSINRFTQSVIDDENVQSVDEENAQSVDEENAQYVDGENANNQSKKIDILVNYNENYPMNINYNNCKYTKRGYTIINNSKLKVTYTCTGKTSFILSFIHNVGNTKQYYIYENIMNSLNSITPSLQILTLQNQRKNYVTDNWIVVPNQNQIRSKLGGTKPKYTKVQSKTYKDKSCCIYQKSSNFYIRKTVNGKMRYFKVSPKSVVNK